MDQLPFERVSFFSLEGNFVQRIETVWAILVEGIMRNTVQEMPFKDFFSILAVAVILFNLAGVWGEGLVKNSCVNIFEFEQAIDVDVLFKDLLFYF